MPPCHRWLLRGTIGLIAGYLWCMPYKTLAFLVVVVTAWTGLYLEYGRGPSLPSHVSFAQYGLPVPTRGDGRCRSLVLLMRPGVRNQRGQLTGSIPKSLSRTPLALSVPLIPGAVPTRVEVPRWSDVGLSMSNYQKTAMANFVVSLPRGPVWAWTWDMFAHCGFIMDGIDPGCNDNAYAYLVGFCPASSEVDANLSRGSPDGNPQVFVQASDLGPSRTLVMYYAAYVAKCMPCKFY